MSKATIGVIEIYYEEHGKGEPLIMVLGLGQDIATWGFPCPIGGSFNQPL